MPGDPSFHLFSNTLIFRARPSGAAAFLLSECRSAPGADAPPNRHPRDDEGFYILSGRYEFSVDEVTRIVGPGDYVPVPNGAPHHFRNIGREIASMLVLNWPGRQHETFFSTLSEAVEGGTEPVSPSGPPPKIPWSDCGTARPSAGWNCSSDAARVDIGR